MKKRKILLILILIIIFSITTFTFIIFVGPKYYCGTNSGPHYCHLYSSNPRLVERISSSFPEDLQVKLGSTLLNLREDLISKEENEKATELALKIYSEINTKPDWINLPSSLGISYEKILKLNLNQTQYFKYIPKNQPEQIIVFLHGFGGNFKSYLYVLSQVAEETNSVIISPSYKNGIWDQNSIEFIDNVIKVVKEELNLKDDLPLNLIGFSNGGLIFPEYIQSSNFRFQNVIGLSTYFDSKMFEQLNLVKLNSSKISYIYGDKDTRLGLEESLVALEFLKNKGQNVNSFEIKGDHLIFFSERSKIIEILINELVL